jgi:type II secretory pathway component PulC
MAYTEFVPHIGEDKIQGFEIWNSNPYSPLNGLGILNGDIITEVNGVKLNSTSSLYRTLETLKRGGKFLIELERNGRPIRYLYTYQ